jgi:hypothetical protein
VKSCRSRAARWIPDTLRTHSPANHENPLALLHEAAHIHRVEARVRARIGVHRRALIRHNAETQCHGFSGGSSPKQFVQYCAGESRLFLDGSQTLRQTSV